MRLFLSYARRDTELAARLQADLEECGHDVWRDHKLIGGESWWARICEEIRSRDGLVFALSPASARSRFCNAEVAYAHSLARPLLTVMVNETKIETAPACAQSENVVPYTGDVSTAYRKLVPALLALRSGVPLPDPLPAPPEAPLGDIPALRDRIVGATTLPEPEQHGIVERLHQLIDGGEEIALDLARQFRSRHGLYEAVARRLDDLLIGLQVTFGTDDRFRPAVAAFVTQAADGKVTPILGSGLTDNLVGSRREMSRALADEFRFPLAPYLRDDLPNVAQYVRVKEKTFTLLERFRKYLDARLRSTIGPVEPSSTDLDGLFNLAWDRRDPGVVDPHEVLASLPCSLFITAHPAQLLEHALRHAGKEPITEVCRWSTDDSIAWPPSPFEDETIALRPTPERPLVYHVFGLLAWPDTLVITEDDYFKFLIGVATQRDRRVPPFVRSALADSALMVLGFGLEDWDFRSLWQALVHQEGNSRLRKYKHVAAQLDPAGSVISSSAAREYLRDYFGADSTPSLELFWGSVAEFTASVKAELVRTHA